MCDARVGGCEGEARDLVVWSAYAPTDLLDRKRYRPCGLGAGQGVRVEVKKELDCTRMVSPAPTTIAR